MNYQAISVGLDRNDRKLSLGSCVLPYFSKHRNPQVNTRPNEPVESSWVKRISLRK